MTYDELKAMSNEHVTRRRPRDIEHSLQQAMVRYFRLRHAELAAVFFAVPNGGQRSKATAAKMKAEGQLSGVSDLMLLVPNQHYHGLCIEVKTSEHGSRQQDTQKAFQKAVEAQGYSYIIVRTLDEFIYQTEQYLYDR